MTRPGVDGPAISVLVKAYNHAPYIQRTIDSILEQSFQDFEIVVTDDASTDGTADILGAYDDPRIRLEVLPVNQGISGAMNATIARARGRYFAILNSDDWALPGRLERQATFLDRNPAVSLVFGLPRFVGENGEPGVSFSDFTPPMRFPDFTRRTWLRHFFVAGNCLCAPTALIRREAYTAAGAYDRRLTNLQDLDMWIRMLIAGHDIHVLPEEMTAFRIRAGNANMSAPRTDTLLRLNFEHGKILRHFATLEPDLMNDVFGDWILETGTAALPPALGLAAVALRVPRLEHQSFALDLLYENARTTGDFNRLRNLAGSLDTRSIRAVEELCDLSMRQDEMLAQMTAGIEAEAQRVKELEAEIARSAERCQRQLV